MKSELVSVVGFRGVLVGQAGLSQGHAVLGTGMAEFDYTTHPTHPYTDHTSWAAAVFKHIHESDFLALSRYHGTLSY